ncbi:hypothetical protein [Micromonospora chersina]|uniref:hypothetical protein n=1 Tax=Micromonospora chersina TaxID=47854 RepID=UPI00372309EB
MEKHVFPRLGDWPIARREMREWQQGLRDAGLSAKTIANIRGESVVPIFKAACRPGEDGELFDLLADADGRVILHLPLSQRRARLERLLAGAPAQLTLTPQTAAGRSWCTGGCLRRT